MAEITKQALKVANNTEFPNNNFGAITPSNLRGFNVDMIDSLVDEITYNADSASLNQSIDALETFTASTAVSITNLNDSSASQQISIDALNVFSASASGLNTGSLLVTASAVSNVITFTKGDASTFNVTVADTTDLTSLNQATASLQAFTASAEISITNLNSSSASQQISIDALNTNSASVDISISALNVFTASQSTASIVTSIDNLNQFSASAEISIANLNAATSSYITSAQTSSMTVLSASFAISSSHSEFADDATNSLYAQNTITTGKNLEGAPIIKGSPLFFTGSGTAGNLVGIYYADAGNPDRMPAGGIAGETIAPGAEGIVLLDGYIGGVDTSLFASGDEVFVGVGGGYTNVAPTGSALIQHLGNVEKSAVNGSGVIQMMGEARGLPNIQNGYAWVGDSNGVPQAVATSSFGSPIDTGSLVTTASFNAYTQSTDVRLTNIESTTASLNTSASLSLTTASINNSTNTITFTKGDSSTFDIVVQTGSVVPIDTGSFVTTSSFNTYTSSTDVRLTNLESTTASLNTSVTNLNSATASLFTSASLGLVTASVNLNTITFTKGDGTTFPLIVDTGSAATIDTGSFATTGSNTFVGNQIISGSTTITGELNTTPALLPETPPAGFQRFNLPILSGSNNTIARDVNDSIYWQPLNNALTISSSAGNSAISPSQIAITNASGNTSGLFTTYIRNRTENGKFIAFSGDPSLTGFSSVTNPAIILQSGSVDPEFESPQYYTPIEFQSSQSFTDGRVTVTTPLIGLQGAEFTGSVGITGTFTSSLQEGYVWVGNNLGRTTTVSTSSFGSTIDTGSFVTTSSFNSYTQSVEVSLSNLNSATGSLFTSASLTLTTASVNLNTITFTKGDGTTFPLTVDTGSGGGGAAFPYTGTASISGSLQVTGSLSSLPITLSVASSTASIDFTFGNNFILDIPTGSTTHIVPTNIIAGQTINLLLKQAAGATTGSIEFSPLVLFPSGYDMVATATGSAIDLVSMISFDTTNVMAANVKNLK